MKRKGELRRGISTRQADLFEEEKEGGEWTESVVKRKGGHVKKRVSK